MFILLFDAKYALLCLFVKIPERRRIFKMITRAGRLFAFNLLAGHDIFTQEIEQYRLNDLRAPAVEIVIEAVLSV